MTRGQRGWLDLRCQGLAPFNTLPAFPGAPSRQASGAAGSRRLHANVRPGLGEGWSRPAGLTTLGLPTHCGHLVETVGI